MDLLLTITEYFFILIAQVIGILFHIGQKIISLDKQYPEKNFTEIRNLFFENEWSSLFVSGVIILAHLFLHGVIAFYLPGAEENVIEIPFTNILVPWGLAGVLIAIVFGYAGQRLAYKYLGKAEQYLSDKADRK